MSTITSIFVFVNPLKFKPSDSESQYSPMSDRDSLWVGLDPAIPKPRELVLAASARVDTWKRRSFIPRKLSWIVPRLPVLLILSLSTLGSLNVWVSEGPKGRTSDRTDSFLR